MTRWFVGDVLAYASYVGRREILDPLDDGYVWRYPREDADLRVRSVTYSTAGERDPMLTAGWHRVWRNQKAS